jgi:CBS-domain-containing membrane protein
MAQPIAMVSEQHRYLREYLDALMESGANVLEAARRNAEEALKAFEAQFAMRRSSGPRVVADVMSRNVRLASPEDTVQQVARLMDEEDSGVVPVGEGDRLVGTVTERVLAVRGVAQGKDLACTKVRELMTPEQLYVFEDEDLEHVAANMAERQVRRLPVVNREKRLLGTVSLRDIGARGRGRRAANAPRDSMQTGPAAAE